LKRRGLRINRDVSTDVHEVYREALTHCEGIRRHGGEEHQGQRGEYGTAERTTATTATMARIHKGAHEEQDLSEPKVLFDTASDEPKAGIQETRRAEPRNDDDNRLGGNSSG
jgi:hypothetical protein